MAKKNYITTKLKGTLRYQKPPLTILRRKEAQNRKTPSYKIALTKLDYERRPRSGWQNEHVLVAESALGKRLPVGAEVHHFDENRLNNAPSNLVICENHDYHYLLHLRAKALKASGDPSFRKCGICGKWDSPRAMYIRPQLTQLIRGQKRHGRTSTHKSCKYIKERARLARILKKKLTTAGHSG